MKQASICGMLDVRAHRLGHKTGHERRQKGRQALQQDGVGELNS
jgi:hypothetical protein